MPSARLLSLCFVLVTACDQAASPVDASMLDGGARDAHIAFDAAMEDAGTPSDAGTQPVDTGPLADSGGAVSYSTSFDLTEEPISEGGQWIHRATPWSVVATSGGVAYGTQPGDGAYTDSYAHLSGFPPNQTATVVIHKDAGFSPGGTREVEILLRADDTADTVRCYECNLAFDGGYAEIVRWNGALGDYTYVAPQGSGGGHAVNDGDEFTAQIVGNVITTFLNGTMLQQIDVTSAPGPVFSDGNPGIAFWRGTGASATPGDYGFTSFSATGLP